MVDEEDIFNESSSNEEYPPTDDEATQRYSSQPRQPMTKRKRIYSPEHSDPEEGPSRAELTAKPKQTREASTSEVDYFSFQLGLIRLGYKLYR